MVYNMNILNNFENVQIIQFGCGGTGSWLVPLCAKLVNVIKELKLRVEQNIKYMLVDGDIIEERNILRQNFEKFDIGKFKTLSLINKYSFSFPSINCHSQMIKRKFELEDLFIRCLQQFDLEITNLGKRKTIFIIIGCIDNNIARRLIHKSLKSYFKGHHYRAAIYIDSGNNLHNGQVITTYYNLEKSIVEECYPELDQDSKELKKKEIEKRYKKEYKLFKDKFSTKEENNNPEEGCIFFGDQSMAINNKSASIIFCNLQNLLINNTFPPFEIQFNSSGWSNYAI